MKKLFAFLLLTLSLTGIYAYAEGTFGELSYKVDDGLYLFSDGGSGDYDSFGFVLSDGVKTIHIYQIGCDFDKPYCAVLKSFPEKELEVRQFICNEGDFLYDVPVYITLKNNQLTTKTLDRKKAEAVLNLKTAVDISLYREAERLSIEKILLDAEGEINASKSAYGVEDALNRAFEKISALKTDEELFAEELSALRAEAILNLKNTVDINLYREAERLSIEKILLEAEGEINTLNTASDIENVVNEAKRQILAFKTDEELFAEELVTLKAEAILNLKTVVDISLYREAERLSIEKILLDAESEISESKSAYGVEDALNRALEKISEFKTDEEYFAEELSDLKAEEISAISGLLDKILYREAEQLEIERIISESTEVINAAVAKEAVSAAASEAKAALGGIPTDAKCRENAALNDEVIGHLDDALDELDGISGLTTKGRILKDIKIIPVIKAVIEDGRYGRMYITRENIKLAYPAEVADVKDYFYNPGGAIDKMNDMDRHIFENKVGGMSMTVISFLKEYFL